MKRPRYELLVGPTPLHRLRRLSNALELDLWIKRDDLTGLALGGNKTRKLEFLVGEALAQDCDTLVTSGAAQSNHCRQTAAAAACAGLACHLALGGDASAPVEGNLLLHHLLGARIHWCGPARKGEATDAICEALRAASRRPYLVPYGGSNVVGATGFVAAIDELKSQCDAIGIEFDAIVFASSSGGTHAGLVAGAQGAALRARLIGVRIDKEPGPGGDLRKEIESLLDGLDAAAAAARIELVEDFLAPGYGVITGLERDAMRRAARSDGILLDPVYTARAFGGLLAMAADGRLRRGTRILFWHTGGIPALFTGSAVAESTPEA